MTKTRPTKGKTFSDKVLEAALAVPEGRVTTYGLIARAAGGGGQSARSVSGILGRAVNSDPTLDIPLHRIVYSSGSVWMHDKYHKTRMKLYQQEGIEVNHKGRIQNFRKILYTF